MIERTVGDILRADAEALVNTVNCVGIMGRGIALQFKNEFPYNYEIYRRACRFGEVEPGKMLVVDLQRLENPRFIINFPTKRHWRGKSKIEDIQAGLGALVKEVQKLRITSLAIPPLGCGLGGLRWSEVRPLIDEAFQPLGHVRVLLFEPSGAPPEGSIAKTRKVPNMTIGRASLLALIRRYLSPAMDPDISLLEIHKLMWFMQVAGEPLRLNYSKGPYGPYAENLRHVLNAMEGHFISGFGDAEDKPTQQILVEAEAMEHAESFLTEHSNTKARIDRVANLIAGFETPYGMELLSTVHWVAIKENAYSSEDAVAKFHSWNGRKEMFPGPHIRLAWNVLKEKGWLTNP